MMPFPPHTLFDLSGRVAVVTGAAQGLGAAMARGLQAQGAQVWIGGRDATALEHAARTMGDRVQPLPFDVSDEAAASAAIAHVRATSGRIDILINNVGQRRRDAFDRLPPDALRQLLESNLMSAWHLCQAVAPLMAAQGSGRIINVTSIAGPIARAGDAAYTTSKGALEAMTRALAAELGPQGILVNAIAPGYFATETNARMVEDPEIGDWLKRRSSLGRWGDPSEIAGAAVFLASPAASYVTGHVLVVDGGYLAHF